MIEMGKKYQTRGDDVHPSVPVRILATDMRNGYDGVQVVALLSCGKEEKLLITDIYGNSNVEKGLDLVPVPTKHEGWCLVDTDAPSYATREEAERAFTTGVYAVWNPCDDRYQIAHVTWED